MNDYFSKMKFSLVYEESTITISADRNKLLSYIKNQAYILYKLKGKIILYYKNRDLTPYLDKQIKDYFKTLRHVNILIKTTPKGNQLSKSLPSIHSNYSLSEQLAQSRRAQCKCFECSKYKINFYCRDCAVFLCKNCRLNKNNPHYSHRTVTLYPEDLMKSAFLYKEIVHGDLNEAKYSRFQEEEEKDNDLVDIDKLNDNLKKSIQDMFDAVRRVDSKLIDLKKFNEAKSNDMAKADNAIEDLDKIKTENTNMALVDKFDQINKKEKEYSDLFEKEREIQKRDLVTKKIEELSKRVERKIYFILSQTLNEKIDDAEYKALVNYINLYYRNLNSSRTQLKSISKSVE